MNKNIEKLINTARNEVGYIEKASNKDLDSKTANPGANNYTKYARDLDRLGIVYNGKKNGYDWCDVFVDWCFITTFGIELGMKLLTQAYEGLGAGCKYSANYYKQKGQFYTSKPQPGDQIFFGSASSVQHTGLVVKVDNSRVYTIEGNTSSAAGVVPNGGCVREKSYSLTYNKIYGYGRPNWSLIPEDNEEDEDMVRYQTIASIPGYAQATIKKLCDKGYLGGSGAPKDVAGYPTDLNLTEDMIRMFVVNDRAKLYGK